MEAKLLPEEVYKQHVEIYSRKVETHRKRRTKLGWLRLCTAVVFFIGAYYSFLNSWFIGWVITILGISVFLFLVSQDVANNEKIAYYERLLYINYEELKMLAGQSEHRDAGFDFLPPDHAYAADLDLFGQSSIYQYINRCTSEQGRALFASALLIPSPVETILHRQEAAQELSQQLNWRQQFQTAGMNNPLTVSTQEKIVRWLSSATPYNHNYWPTIVLIYSGITLSCLALFILDLLPWPIFSMLIFLFFVISLLISRKITDTYYALTKVVNEVQTIHQQLHHFEGLKCDSTLLNSLQENLHQKGVASENILALQRILNRFDYRLNILVFFVLNTFLLWDLRQMISLNNWKNKNHLEVEKWFTTIASVELLNTLATSIFNQPGWVFPSISEKHFTLEANEIGHPLIREDKRINNSFSTKGTGKVSIITGSNMAGKSTFLRSLGVNLVLAQMGATVCAKSFTCSPVHLFTSMRISDNLAENTSTFYAELKKLKEIIHKVNAHEKVFVLLDEILRGTNSLDKHQGSEALIKQFISKHAVAVIATHDVELGKLQNDYAGHIENYYFDVQVEGEELYFDYKIKRGICQSMNASLLMKKIGIEI